MKKIYFVLLVTLILGFAAGSKASGQPGCENCVAPWSCATFTLTINCNGVEFPVEYTVCYFCSPTAPVVNVVTMRVGGLPIGTNCYYTALQAAENWILENGIELCGTIPCQYQIKRFRIYFPTCSDVILLDDHKYIISINPQCDYKCYNEYEWCWCSCEPTECWFEECEEEGPGYPKVHFRRIYCSRSPSLCEPFIPPQDWVPGTKYECKGFPCALPDCE